MIFKMRRYYAALGIVRRMLHRAKVGNVHVLRYDNKAAGVLACCALNADKALGKAVFLDLCDLDPTLLEIFFNIAVGRFLGKSAYRSGAENVIRSEKLFGVFMCLRLIFAGEVKVDIGRFLISRETEEGLERDIKTVLPHKRSALGAVFRRHVRAAAVGAVGYELGMLAFGADIVRRKRVDLGDAGHVCHDRRTDGATRADEVAMLERVLNKLLGGHVDNVIVMVKYRSKLGIDARFYDLRRIFTVNIGHFAVDKIAQVTRRVFYLRWEQILGQKLDIIDHIGNGTRIFDNDLVRDLVAEIVKLLEHLIGRAEEDRAAAVGIGEFLCRLKYLAVLLVLGIEKMHVACGDDRLIELTADIEYAAVIVLQNAYVADNAVINKESVIAERLNFKIIVKRRYALELGVARAVHHSAVKLAHTAGGAYQQPLAVLYQQAFRHGRGFVKVLEIRLRNKLVQVFKADLVFYQQYHMPRLCVVGRLDARIDLLNTVYGLCSLLREHRQESSHYARNYKRVIRRTMVVKLRQTQPV